MKLKNARVLPAEWQAQSAVMLTWPHAETDWLPYLDEAEICFTEIAHAIAKRQKLVIVCPDVEAVKTILNPEILENVRFLQAQTNDTWARDHGAITVFEEGIPYVLDFCFNGWGLKFAADKDNLITQQMYHNQIFAEPVEYENHLNFVFEGGSIESDGRGTLLTTSECLLSPNRNGGFRKDEVEHYLTYHLGANDVLWLDHGYLAGDDTDSHIDTLARFCSTDTIAYVQCTDTTDEHYTELLAMEKELKQFRQKNGEPYKLIPLPMAEAVYFEGERLPATYANFLIINGAVLAPTYGLSTDSAALEALQIAFPEHEIVGIRCDVLIKQHGSLHCVTMQFPEGIIH